MCSFRIWHHNLCVSDPGGTIEEPKCYIDNRRLWQRLFDQQIRVNFNAPFKLFCIYFKNMAQHNISETNRGSLSVTIHVSQRSNLAKKKIRTISAPEPGQIFKCRKVGCSFKLWHIKHVPISNRLPKFHLWSMVASWFADFIQIRQQLHKSHSYTRQYV